MSEATKPANTTTSIPTPASTMFNDNFLYINKCAVSLVTEICTKYHLFKDVCTSNNKSNPYMYDCQFKVGDLVVRKSGLNKKKVINDAALDILESIAVNQNYFHSLALKQEIDHVLNKNKSSLNEISSLNSLNNQNINNVIKPSEGSNVIGELLKFAQMNFNQVPKFSFGPNQGPAHMMLFQCTASCGNCTSSGVNTTKQKAKSAAALNLLVKLRELVDEKTNSKNTSLSNRMNNTSYDRNISRNERRSNGLLDLDINKKCLSELLSGSFKYDHRLDYLGMLEELIYEQELIATVEEINCEFSEYCRVQITIRAKKVYHYIAASGIGYSNDEASNDAAFNILNCIRAAFKIN